MDDIMGMSKISIAVKKAVVLLAMAVIACVFLSLKVSAVTVTNETELKAAIGNIPNYESGEITINNAITLTSAISNLSYKTVTINGTGSIRTSGSILHFTLSNACVVNLTGDLILDRQDASSTSGGFTVNSGCTLNISGNVQFSSYASSGSRNSVNGGTLNLSENAQILRQGVLVRNNAAFNMTGGRITYNGVTVEAGGTFTMSGGLLERCDYIVNGGGGVLVKGTFIMNDGATIRSCNSYGSSAWGGGGVAVDTGGSFTMHGGSIENNNGTVAGGGGVAVRGVFNMYGGKITGNRASSNYCGPGGGVAVVSGGVFNIYGGEISGNNAVGAGGGVAVYTGGTFNMNGGVIGNNTAYLAGGIYLDEGAVFNNAGGTVSPNTSSVYPELDIYQRGDSVVLLKTISVPDEVRFQYYSSSDTNFDHLSFPDTVTGIEINDTPHTVPVVQWEFSTSSAPTSTWSILSSSYNFDPLGINEYNQLYRYYFRPVLDSGYMYSYLPGNNSSYPRMPATPSTAVSSTPQPWDLFNFVRNVEIEYWNKDLDKNGVIESWEVAASKLDLDGGEVYASRYYKIRMNFAEGTDIQFKYNENGKLVYQLPDAFILTGWDGERLFDDTYPLTTATSNNKPIGWYTVSETGLLEVWFEKLQTNGQPTPAGENWIEYYSNCTMWIEFTVLMGKAERIRFGPSYYAKAEITFKYIDDTCFKPEVHKTVSGEDAPNTWAFSFDLYSSDQDGSQGTLLDTKTVNATSPTITFAEQRFTSTGAFYFLIKEQTPDADRWISQNDTYLVKVNVGRSSKSDGEQCVVESVEYKLNASGGWLPYAGTLEFSNEYMPPPPLVTLKVNKTATGRAMTAGQFTFTLYESDVTGKKGTLLQQKTNTSAGSDSPVSFDVIEHTAAGTYYYLLEETSGGGNGWSRDTTQYLIIVKVGYSGSGSLTISDLQYMKRVNLSAAFTNYTGEITFVNRYQDNGDNNNPYPSPSPTTPSGPDPTTEPDPSPEPSPDSSPDPSPNPDPNPDPEPGPGPGSDFEPYIPGGNDPDILPVPNTQGNTLEPTGDGRFIEIDGNGVPLGEWYWDPIPEKWIFDEYPPQGNIPRTGDPMSTTQIFAFAGLSLIGIGMTLRMLKRGKRWQR